MTEITILIIATPLWVISLIAAISLTLNPTRATVTWGEILQPQSLRWQFWKALLKIYWRELWLLFFSPFGWLLLVYYLLRIIINGITTLPISGAPEQGCSLKNKAKD